MTCGHLTLPAVFPVMDGRLRMTLRMLRRYDSLDRMEKPPAFKRLADGSLDSTKAVSGERPEENPERAAIRSLFSYEDDLMAVPLVERCDCGAEMTVGDYACWGRCFVFCAGPALAEAEEAHRRELQRWPA